MRVREIMTGNPVFCTPETSLRDVASKMRERDCGLIPITERDGSKRLRGVVTDRDIVVRAIADGRNPLDLKAADVMSERVSAVSPDTTLDEAARIMEKHQVRRLPVVSDGGDLIGIVSQADIAMRADGNLAAEVVREVSKPQS
jgi:CBS domain-containing protein